MSYNPFIDDSIVTASDYCPRQKPETYILQKIRTGHNLALIGDRRIGKSSTIHYVIDEKTYRFTNPFFKEWILDYRAYIEGSTEAFQAGIPLKGTRLDFGYRNTLIEKLGSGLV